MDREEVSYDNLRVFSCRAFVHIPKDERFKLDPKANQCIFLGYGHEEFGYRLYDPVDKKVVRSRDVVFLEDHTIEDIDKLESAESSTDDLVDLDPLDPPIVHDINEEVQTPHDDAAEDDVEPEIEGEQPPQESLPQTPLRRSTREKQPSKKYSSSEYVMISDQGEPETYQEVLKHENKTEWLKAMKEEMKYLHESHTYDLVKPPKKKKILKNKWVFRRKNDGNSSQPRFKARLVVKRFGQRKGVDFDEIFSPVLKMSSIRTVLGIATSMNLKVEQLDVKTAFLHGDLEEEIYMEQPEGFIDKGNDQLVCKLKKSLYGLKKAPRQWYRKFDSFMTGHGY